MKRYLAILAAAIIVAGGAYYWNIQSDTPPQNNEDSVACTQEALLCPDGSYVGRQGAACAFASCPNADPFTGRLEQRQGEFRLIMESPEKNQQEVSYALPLAVKISNVLGQLVGKKVKAFGAFGEGNLFQVDRLEAHGDITLGELAVGETKFINGVLLTLKKITQDNRCPVDVQCVHAGWVAAVVALKSDTDASTETIESNQPPISLDTFLISIDDVKPDKVSFREINSKDYLLTFKVTSR